MCALYLCDSEWSAVKDALDLGLTPCEHRVEAVSDHPEPAARLASDFPHSITPPPQLRVFVTTEHQALWAQPGRLACFSSVFLCDGSQRVARVSLLSLLLFSLSFAAVSGLHIPCSLLPATKYRPTCRSSFTTEKLSRWSSPWRTSDWSLWSSWKSPPSFSPPRVGGLGTVRVLREPMLAYPECSRVTRESRAAGSRHSAPQRQVLHLEFK